MGKDNSIRKVMVIGSGPIVIGQAAEFDYAGTQACRVLKAEGIETVLVNSNPATVMTDTDLADAVYLEPLTVETVKRIIRKEKPDCLLAGLGGQTGLTLAVKLYEDGFLEENGVRLIGSNVEAIKKSEDRQLFKDTMAEIGEPTIPSDTATDVEKSLRIAEEIGYPVIVRPAYTLGGGGGGVAYDAEELKTVAASGISASPIGQILVEKYIYGWKEIEFETMRDSKGNVIAVCSMENVDPVGVHTGDSVVVAPALTLSDREYQTLRSASLNIISALGIVGGCNCQFALDPVSFDYAVIEVNPRVSRSSALASKATGYPIAKITAKIALGYTLDEIRNDVTGKTCACFEPALDYVVVKLPKWPFDKLHGSSRKLGTQMKATGEVMAIAPSFPAALMKAVRGAEIGTETLGIRFFEGASREELLRAVGNCDDRRLFAVFSALKAGITIDEISKITRIDPFFLAQIKRLSDYENRISGVSLDSADYLEGKKLGYTDAALDSLSGYPLPCHREAVFRIVDTCGGEFDAETPYYYSTYDEDCEARHAARAPGKTVVVLGSGPIRIGQGIEFDYSSVHCATTLRRLGYEVVIINNNPETVSTDYDTADRLYFEPLTPEDVMNVVAVEEPVGVVVAFGGQTAIKLTKYLDSRGVKILGTSAEGIDTAEDRERFDALLGSLGIKRPKGMGVTGTEEAIRAANELGYPVLLRPSYVIGGQNMRIVYSDREVREYMAPILEAGVDSPVLVDKYMSGIELELDVISDGEDVLIPGIMEHVERAGVHSGDSIAVIPAYKLNDKMTSVVISQATAISLALGTRGLVNIQLLIWRGEPYVIEVNPRASRTVPYISKVTGVPMIELATRVMVGEKLKNMDYGTGLYRTPPYFAVKVPVFSFEKLPDAFSGLGPEMKSTGEVLGVGKDLNEALFKGMRSAGLLLPSSLRREGVGFFLHADEKDVHELIDLSKKLGDLHFTLYASASTAGMISKLGNDVKIIDETCSDGELLSLLDKGDISYVVYSALESAEDVRNFDAIHARAIALSVPCLTSLDTAEALADIIMSRYAEHNTELVDINTMRSERMKLSFSKMEATGADYIVIDDRDGAITCPESLCIRLCDRHYGVGGYGIALIENPENPDAHVKMRLFNRDGSEGFIAGTCIRSVAKYVYDRGIVKEDVIKIETAAGIRAVSVYTSDGRVTMAGVDMGRAEFAPEKIPCTLGGGEIVDRTVRIADGDYRITCLSVGNPHCVVFCDRVDNLDLDAIGPKFEHDPIFPERVNTEFVRVVDPTTLRMRVWERGNGETFACGTGACAAVAAAVKNGICPKGEDVTVKVTGGDLIVNFRDDGITLSGDAELVFDGVTEY